MLQNGCGKNSLAHIKLRIDPKEKAHTPLLRRKTIHPRLGQEENHHERPSSVSSFRCALRHIKRVEAYFSTLAGTASCWHGVQTQSSQQADLDPIEAVFKAAALHRFSYSPPRSAFAEIVASVPAGDPVAWLSGRRLAEHAQQRLRVRYSHTVHRTKSGRGQSGCRR